MMKTTSYLALATAASLLIGGATLAPKAARAADLGGDCCADLEARVAELEATTARKGNRKVSLTITGQVHYNIMYWSENSGPGTNTDANGVFDKSSGVNFGNVDGDESHVTFQGSGKISSDLHAGFVLEIREDADASSVNQNVAQGLPKLSAQHEYVYLQSDRLGTLQLGNNDTAYDDSPYQVFGGGEAGGLSGGHFGGNLLLRGPDGTLTSRSYGSALGEIYDNKAIQLRYITPTLGTSGFTFKASIGDDRAYAAELLWAHDFDKVKVKWGIGFNGGKDQAGSCQSGGNQCTAPYGVLNDINHTNLESYAASGSIWDTNSGFYVSGELAQAKSDISGHDDGKNYWIQGGWEKNVNGLGDTTIYGTYFKADNMIGNGTSAHWVNVGIDQAIDSVASDIYLHYQRDTFDGCSNTASGDCISGRTASSPLVGAQSPNVITGGIASQSVDTITAGMITRF